MFLGLQIKKTEQFFADKHQLKPSVVHMYGHMKKQKTEMKLKLETVTGNGNGEKRRTNHWCNIFFIVCLVVTQVIT